MDNVSVSKGVFAYKGSYKIGQKKNKPKITPLFNEPWYFAYKELWSTIEKSVKKINTNMFTQIVSDLESFVSTIDYSTLSDEIPTAIMLTGVNLPDHEVLFRMIAFEFKDVCPNFAIVQSRDSYSIKNMTEETVHQLINNSTKSKITEVKKNQCSLSVLNVWYKEQCKSKEPLLIIIPDFESFPAEILQDFILILSVYSKSIKFVLVFGVATALHAVHRSLPHHVTSKLKVQVFHTQTQVKSLSDVLEGTVLSTETPFKLTGRAFQLLTDIFLFYDFSVNGFLQGYKLCMMQHFYGNNMHALCCGEKDVKEKILRLTEEDLMEIKKLPSVAKHLEELPESKRSSIKDQELKELLLTLLHQMHTFMCEFLIVVKCLHVLTSTLPEKPLGKELREVYSKAVSCTITESQEYKKCIQFLGFLSKDELLSKLEAVLKIIENPNETFLKGLKTNLTSHMNTIRNASLEVPEEPIEMFTASKNMNRMQMKEKLLQMTQKHSCSPYKEAQTNVMNYLDQEVFSIYLKNPSQLPANEIFYFADGNAVKRHIVGAPRASIHTALNNPQAYLECSCCKLDNDQTYLASLPDLSVIYKLHLECRRLINMYDWLQAFLTIVSPNDGEDEQREVDTKVQARFTRAVAELQFLGFIKTSRKKTDHVMRLTWGSCS